MKEFLDSWAFQVDQDGFGEKEKWFEPRFDRSGWMKVKVPGAWDFYHQAFWGYEDVGWFAVEIPEEGVKTDHWQRLSFESVSGHAKVWINGEFVGEHVGRYLPFEFAVTPHLRQNESNTVVMRVDNISQSSWLPGSGVIEWAQYGGILQPVSLLTNRFCFITDVAIEAKPEQEGAVVHIGFEIFNSGQTDFEGVARIRIHLDDQVPANEVNVRCSAGEKANNSFAFRVRGVERWSVDHPKLYQVTVELFRDQMMFDEKKERFGIRAIETRGSEILLNGQPIELHGFNRYDEYESYGPTVPEPIVREDLMRIKKTGANLVRVHYPQSPAVLRIMDEIGLLLMEEVPLNWWQAEDGEESRKVIEAAEEALQQLIRRDRNHPCVIIWSMCNECATNTDIGIAAMRRLMRKAREWDKTRLVTFVTTSSAGHAAFDEADLICVNLYYGLFNQEIVYRIDEMEERVRKPTEEHFLRLAGEYPDKPIVLSEYGTHSVYGLKGDTRFSETYQTEYIEAVWRAVKTVKQVRGTALWAWADYYHRKDFFGGVGPTTWSAAFGPYGVVTVDRKPKNALSAVTRLFQV